MYSMKPVPAEPPCRAGPGFRCTSPSNASQLASVPSRATEPFERRISSWSRTLGPEECMHSSASTLGPPTSCEYDKSKKISLTARREMRLLL